MEYFLMGWAAGILPGIILWYCQSKRLASASETIRRAIYALDADQETIASITDRLKSINYKVK